MSLLGERFKQERDARGISIFQVEIDTRIRAAVLEMIEAGDYAHLPPEPFLRGLVRSYANYLRIDPIEALDLLSVDLVAHASRIVPQKTPPRVPPPPAPKYIPTPTPTYLPEPSAAPQSIQQTVVSWIKMIRQSNIPLPVTIAVAVVVAFICVVCGGIAFTQISDTFFPTSISRAVTTTRVPGTNTPTPAVGAPPTNISVLQVTAAPFPTFPGNATATPRAVPRRTIEIQTGLNVDIDANGSIKVLVGVDNAPAFNGTMDPGTTRSWSAKESIYVRIENASSAVLYFNGREQLPAVFAERSVMERRWMLDKGTPIRTAPFTPAPPTATRTVTPSPVYTVTPLSFDTPTLTPTPF